MSAWCTAVKIVAKMKGSSDSYLIEASNRKFYVIKHSQGSCRERLLVNEMFAAALARRIGLPIPVVSPIVVPAFLVQEGSADHLGPPWTPGLHCGSEYAAQPLRPAYDYLPDTYLSKIANLDAVAGCWIFDVWTGNADRTQAVFYRRPRARIYEFSKIDHGWCFGAGDWIARDLRRDFLRWQKPVLGKSAFAIDLLEPYFRRIRMLSPEKIAASAETLPPEWFSGPRDPGEFERLVLSLGHRAAKLEEHARTCWPVLEYHCTASAAT